MSRIPQKGDKFKVVKNDSCAQRPQLKEYEHLPEHLQPGEIVIADEFVEDGSTPPVPYILFESAGNSCWVKGIARSDYQRINMSDVEYIKPESTSITPCTCSRITLMRSGCTCGHLAAIKTNKSVFLNTEHPIYRKGNVFLVIRNSSGALWKSTRGATLPVDKRDLIIAEEFHKLKMDGKWEVSFFCAALNTKLFLDDLEFLRASK